MIAYTTPSSTSVPADKFVYALKGNMNSFPRSRGIDLFNRLIQMYGVTKEPPVLRYDQIVDAICKDSYPEIFEGISEYLTIYAIPDTGSQYYGRNEFLDLLQDMYAASPSYFEDTLQSVWVCKSN
jgi:hypothetical protein